MKFIFTRSFHSSYPLFQMPTHKLFKLIDWNRIEAGDYAVVNPADPTEVLYLTERDYIVQVRVSMTQNHRLLTLATPTTPRPSESENSPPNNFMSGEPNFAKFRRVFNSTFRWAKQVSYVSGREPTVMNLIVVTERNLLTLLDQWSMIVWSRIEGLRSSGTFRREVWAFVQTLQLLYRRHGLSEVITRLKLYLFVVSSYVAGRKLSTTDSLGKRIRLAHGLPKILPLRVRVLLRNRDPATIRIWSSIFYVYKAIADTHKAPKFDMIESGVPDRVEQYRMEFPYFKDFSPRFVEWLYSLTGIDTWLKMDLIPKTLFSAASAGPNCSWGLGGLPLDTLAWISLGWRPGNPLRDYMLAVGDEIGENMFWLYAKKLILSWYTPEHAYNIIDRVESGESIPEEELRSVTNKQFIPPHILVKERGKEKLPTGKLKPLLTGKLAALPEAAGKVRIIAIVDAWTQTYLSPLHDFFFSILKKIPTDATFDQQGAVSEFAKKGYKELYSYDLTAATDTIPWTLYREVMCPFFGEKITDTWLALLRNRDWILPKWKDHGAKVSKQLKHEGRTHIRYNRGQPMGAKSSWGALALTHHALVQYAANQVGLFPFLDYLVLGDDIVIANKDVAIRYRNSCTNLGVKIGLAKSFTSCEGFFNFASQSFLNDLNLSPLSFKEEIASTGASSRMESLWKAVDRGLLNVGANDFFAKAVRWLVPPRTLRVIEEDRKRGVLNEVGKWCATAIFTSLLEGKHFYDVEGLSVSNIVTGLIRPSLSLFTRAVPAILTTQVKKNWLTYSGELCLLVVDRACREIGKKLLDKGNIIRGLIGQPPLEELTPIEWTPPALEINRGALGLLTEREIEFMDKLESQDHVKVHNEHLDKIKLGSVRDAREWSYLSLRIFGRQISLARVVRITDKLICQLGSINPAIELFSAELVWKLAKDIIPEYNQMLLQHQICSVKLRHFLGTMPHLIPQVFPDEVTLLQRMNDHAEIPFGVLSVGGRGSSKSCSDKKIFDILMLCDRVRFLKDLESKR